MKRRYELTIDFGDLSRKYVTMESAQQAATDLSNLWSVYAGRMFKIRDRTDNSVSFFCPGINQKGASHD